MRCHACPYWGLFYIPGADAADEPIGTHQEAAAEGLPSGKGSSVIKWGGPCCPPLPRMAGATALTVCGLLTVQLPTGPISLKG